MQRLVESEAVHIVPEIRAQEWFRKRKEVSHNYLIVSKKVFSNSPNTYIKAKQDKITVLKQEAMHLNETAINSISLARRDLILCANPLTDQNRFSKMNLDLIQNIPDSGLDYKQYYSSILSNQDQSKYKVDDMISFPEPEVRIQKDDELLRKSQQKYHFDPIVKKLHKGLSDSKDNSKIAFSNIYSNKFKYIVTSGNNSKLIREAMNTRPWWVEIPNVDTAFNFKWQPVSFRMKFRELNTKSKAHKQIVNHFEYHKYLSEKSELFLSLQSHCEFIKSNVFDMMPLQFFIKIDPNVPNAMNNALATFHSVFNMIEESKQVFENINATRDIHSDQIIDESMLNTNLIKSDNVGISGKSTNPTRFKSFNFQK